ncbi:MAG: DnaJ domain-containing protein [Thermodesulfobacteriota bacterium]
MKDYYKILGLKETATAEEIHERWIELMQACHPDHSPDGKSNGEMAKEINEAYQALKHSDSRVEYDLERERLRRQKKSSAWKVIVSVSGLTIFVILTVFLFRKFETPASLDQRPPLASPGVTLPSTVPSEEPARQIVSSSKPSLPEDSAKTDKPKEEAIPPERIKREEKVSLQRVQQEGKMPPAVPKKKAGPLPPVARSEALSTVVPSTSKVEAERPRPVESQKPATFPETPEKLGSGHTVSGSGESAKKEGSFLVSKLPPAIATEEEVGDFFQRYIDRYNKKDIDGFLSLFSPKAVQNQRDGLEGIRRIYENFFYQSLELRYSVEEMSVEIYQNAVEVKGRYQVDQISRIGGERKVWKGRIQWMLVKEDEGLKIVSINYRHESSP